MLLQHTAPTLGLFSDRIYSITNVWQKFSSRNFVMIAMDLTLLMPKVVVVYVMMLNWLAMMKK